MVTWTKNSPRLTSTKFSRCLSKYRFTIFTNKILCSILALDVANIGINVIIIGVASVRNSHQTSKLATEKQMSIRDFSWTKWFRSILTANIGIDVEYRSVMSQKNKFVKLSDVVPFSSKASLENGPCQKLPLNCNSQPKYKGWKFDTAPL